MTDPNADTDPQGVAKPVKIENLVMRIVATSTTGVKVEVADVVAETVSVSGQVGGPRQRTVRIGEWRDPTNEERDVFEALVWT